MFRATYIVAVLFIALQTAAAQDSSTDSLTRALTHAVGRNRVDVLNQLTYAYLTHDNDLAMKYCDQSIALSRELGYDKGEGVAYSYKGVYENLSREFSTGRTSLRTGLRFSRTANDRSNEGYSLFQLGNTYLDQSELDSALALFDQAYVVLRDSTNPITLSKLYRNLSILYGLKAEYDAQDRFMERCLAIRKRAGNQALIADGLNVLAGFSIRRGDYEEATKLLQQVETIVRAHPTFKDELNDWRHQEALILLRDREFDKAMVLFDSAKTYYIKTSRMLRLVSLEKDLGKIFFDRGEYELALRTEYEALKVAKLKQYAFEIMDIQLQLGWVNYELGELSQSLAFADTIYARLKNHNMPNREADALTLKGVVSIELRDFAQARWCLENVMTIRKKSTDEARISEANLNLGNLEEQMKHYTAANELYQKSYTLAEESNYAIGKAWSLIGLSKIALQNHRYESVESLLTKAESNARSMGSNEALIRIYQIRGDFMAAEGKYKEAYYFANRSSQLKDSVHRQDLAKRFISLQRLDEIEERDRNIKALTQDRQLAQEKITLQGLKLRQQYLVTLAVSLGFALVGVLAFMYWRYYQRIKQLNSSIRFSSLRIQSQADDLAKANKELSRVYQAVKEQKEEIETQADVVAKSNSHIQELNRNLEALVEQKTRDLQQANEELIRHNHDLLQFSYSLSHHLRGPVARLLGLTSLIPHASTKEEIDRMVEMVNKTSHDLDAVIGDLSRVIDIRNDLYQRKESTQLAEVWSNSYLLLQNVIAEEFDIQADFREAPELVTIKTIVQSVFYNLLSNAIKYRSPDRPLEVRVTSHRAGKKVILEFRDNGLGIDLTKYKDSVFKLFKRFHAHVESRGIGLYLIKSQLEGLKGSIEIESEVDKGTMFRVIVPDAVFEMTLVSS